MEEQSTNLAILLGAVLPFLISFVKRFVQMDERTTYSFVFIICLSVAGGLRLYQSSWNVSLLLSDLFGIFTSSQLMYSLVIKQLHLDNVIEGEKIVKTKVLPIELK